MMFNRKQKFILLLGSLFLVFNYFWMLDKQVVPDDLQQAFFDTAKRSSTYTSEEALDDLNATKIRYRELAKNNFYAGAFVIVLLTGAGIGVFTERKPNK